MKKMPLSAADVEFLHSAHVTCVRDEAAFWRDVASIVSKDSVLGEVFEAFLHRFERATPRDSSDCIPYQYAALVGRAVEFAKAARR